MRQVIYDYIGGLNLGNFFLSNNLPWMDNGEFIYHHNKKYVYVDTDQTSQQPLIDTMNGSNAVIELTTVNVYIVNDAKTLPVDYDAVVEIIKGARTAPGTEGFTQRLCQVFSGYHNDNLVTTFTFSFRKLLTN